MDNASFCRTERMKQMCLDTEVKLIYLPPYSPDLNPIEGFLEPKQFIKRKWNEYEENPGQGFNAFSYVAC